MPQYTGLRFARRQLCAVGLYALTEKIKSISWGNIKPVTGVIVLFVFLGAVLLLMNNYGNKFLDGARGYIMGESYWASAQKQASLSLIRYIDTDDDEAYLAFLGHLDVVESARQGRNELLSTDPDYDVVRTYYQNIGHREQDIDGLIWLYENFKTFPQIQRVVDRWIEGEMLTEQMRRAATLTYDLGVAGELNREERQRLMIRVYTLDQRITENQTALKNELKEAADWASSLVYWFNVVVILILFFAAATFLILQIRTIRKYGKKVRVSENKFRDVLNYSRDVIYRLDVNTGKYVYMSPSVKKITGYDVKEFMEGGIDFVLDITHPEDAKRMESEVVDYDAANAVEKLSQDSEFRIKTKDGRYIWINNKRSLVLNGDGKATAIIGNVRDISERKEYVEALDASLKEKEMLLSEIHHRVKNNLSIVSSLVELQKSSFEGEESKADASLSEIQSRIKSIALVHEKLYQNETFADIDLSDYIADLVDMIHTTFASKKRNITMNKEMDSLIVDIKEAVPLGLICNELINNCYKYAFTDRDSGEIRIELSVNGETAELKVSDDGVGLPDDFDKESTSLGMTLINVLTQQIGGELNFESDNGTTVTITFEV